jgi:hypothetical protein
MTLLEMVVAMMMLVMFTGVVVAVLEVTSRYAGEVESGPQGSNGVLIDHQEIQIGLDQLAEVLGQPGISKDRLDGLVPGEPQIAFAPSTNPDQACAPAGSDPLQYWRLPGPRLLFPPGYRICVWRTGLVEASTTDLLSNASGARAGIYVLQALPERADAASLPTRRLFCRPRPFC